MADEVVLMPFYLLLGVDDEHRAATEKMLVALRDDLAVRPTVADHVRFGIIEFGADAQVRLPLCDLLDPELTVPPPPPATEGCAYGSALSALYTAIAEDVPALMDADDVEVRRPLAWLLTDRAPTDPPSARDTAFRALADSPGYPYIVPTGFADAPDHAVRPLIHPTAGETPMAAFHAHGPDGVTALGDLLARTMLAVPRLADSGSDDVVVLPDADDLTPGVSRMDAPPTDGATSNPVATPDTP